MTPALRMNCSEFETLLSPYLDGEFEAEERVEVERHLETCAECVRRLEVETSFRGALKRTAQQVATQERAPDRLRAAMSARISEEEGRHRRTRIAQLSAAALVLVTAGSGYLALRTPSDRPYVEQAALWHARQLPTEVNGEDPAGVERWFGGKLDHRVPVPRFANARVAGARLSLVKDRPAAYITYVAQEEDGPRRMGLFVFADSEHDISADPLPAVELAQSHGYNVARWREGEIVYQLVSDLKEADIRRMVMAPQGTRALDTALVRNNEPATDTPLIRTIESKEDVALSWEPVPASFAATHGPSPFERLDVRPATLQR